MDKKKSIRLLLYDGELDGIIRIEDSSWIYGELYVAPRNSLADLFETDILNRLGLYILLSNDMVFVGQTTDFAMSIRQHTIDKDWWERIVILTTKNNNLKYPDFAYLEILLVKKALMAKQLICKNKEKSIFKASEPRKIMLNQYLNGALTLMRMIGVNAFNVKRNESLIKINDFKTRFKRELWIKSEVIAYLADKGIIVGNAVTYSKRQRGRNEFWSTPRKQLLNKEWWIILNDNQLMRLFVLKIPKNTFTLDSGAYNRLRVRVDKPDLIDLNINTKTLIDRKSKIDFSPYVVKNIEY